MPPGIQGEYNVAFIVREWRRLDGEWFLQGYVTRDMQIIIEDCNNGRPEIIAPPELCVEAGTEIEEFITGTDPDGPRCPSRGFWWSFCGFPE